MGALKNPFDEVILISSHNIVFLGKLTKISFNSHQICTIYVLNLECAFWPVDSQSDQHFYCSLPGQFMVSKISSLASRRNKVRI